MDSWRKHKKALNAAKYYEELPVTEKINANPEPKIPMIETKQDSKLPKTIKSNKKISPISLPVTKQANNSESPITVLNSSPPPPPLEVVKKPIASVAPYQIVLPKQPIVTIVQPERLVEKANIAKSKPIQSVHNKIEKEPATVRPVLSKKSISDDDGLLAEYKYMKKKNKSERKASLTPSAPPTILPVTVKPKVQSEKFNSQEIVKPKIQTVDRFNSQEVLKSKVQTLERFNTSEVIKSKIQTAERMSMSEGTKPKIQTVERFNSQEVIKSKVQSVDRYNLSEGLKPKAPIVERCNSPELLKQNNNEIITIAASERENNEVAQLKKSQTDQQLDVEKKIIVLKRSTDEKHSDSLSSNKHGKINFFNNILVKYHLNAIFTSKTIIISLKVPK